MRVLTPPPPLTVSEWADTYRFLSPEASAEPGRWNTNRNPIARGVMDALNDPTLTEIVVMSATQLLKTEFILNACAYHVHQDPCPILVIQPTLEMAESFSKERLAPMIRDTPVLTALFADPRARDSGNTLRKKQYPGGYIQMAGANSPASLAMRAVRLALMDEVDRYPLSAGSEGDPVRIVAKRLKTFWNRKQVMVSSPTDEGTSRIALAMEGSDYRKPYVVCVHCRAPQVMEWKHVIWPEGEPQRAAYHCAECGAVWNEPARMAALARHEWRPTQEASVPGRAGYWANELYSPFVTPADMAIDFIEAKKSNETLKTFVNTSLAETWSHGEELAPEPLYQRRESYDRRERGGNYLTAGVDVQADRLEAEIVEWGEGEEAWSVAYLRLEGDPKRQGVWDTLHREMSELYPLVNGGAATIGRVCVDSGYATDEVHAFCRRDRRRYTPTKGHAEAGKPLFDYPRKPGKQQTFLTMVGTDAAKDLIMSRLALAELGPGFCHWPRTDDYDLEYFHQLTAEKMQIHYRRGHPYRVWVQSRPRNEALDCRILALVAVRIAQRFNRVRLCAILPDVVLDKPAPRTAPPPSPTPQISDPRRRRRGLFD